MHKEFTQINKNTNNHIFKKAKTMLISTDTKEKFKTPVKGCLSRLSRQLPERLTNEDLTFSRKAFTFGVGEGVRNKHST